jgi:cytochrome P450
LKGVAQAAAQVTTMADDQIDLTTANLMDPATIQCPFAYYAAARNKAPVLKLPVSPIPGADVYLVTTYELISQILPDWKRFSNRFGEVMGGAAGFDDPELMEIWSKGWAQVSTMLTEDPPEQRHYRALVTKAFSASRVDGMGPYITQICDELIDKFIDRGECDFFADFAIPLPIYVIADQLGVARGDLPAFKAWSRASVATIGRMQGREGMIAAAKATVEMQTYFVAVIEERRKNPRDDIISELANAHFKGERLLTVEEMLSILQQLLVAGNETTTNALAGGLVYILDQPGKAEHFHRRPEDLPNAVEEILRLEAPTKGMWRVVKEDCALAGVDIPKGSVLLLSYDAANRDEAHFPNGEACDFARANASTHFSFGSGIHACVGAMLSRKEMTIAYERLFARLTNIRLAQPRGELRYIESLIHRGFVDLAIAFDRR